MKLSGNLKRTTPLKRGTSQLKRSPLKQMSSKKRKQTLQFQPAREAFKAELGCVCGRVATDTHEVWGGACRSKSFECREGWLPGCRAHHVEIQDWSKAKQYALKQIIDPDWYDLEKLNELGLRRVSAEEVEAEMAAVKEWIQNIRRNKS